MTTSMSFREEPKVKIELRRLDLSSQTRLDDLLEKNNEGTLTPEERQELEGLVARYEDVLLQNSETLLRATRPDLVDESGRIDRARLAGAVRRTARALRKSDVN